MISYLSDPETCPTCEGAGRIVDGHPCPTCDGEGEVTTAQAIVTEFGESVRNYDKLVKGDGDK